MTTDWFKDMDPRVACPHAPVRCEDCRAAVEAAQSPEQADLVTVLKLLGGLVVAQIVYEIDAVERVRWALHNGLAHPLMVVLPRTLGDLIHNVTAPLESPKKETPR